MDEEQAAPRQADTHAAPAETASDTPAPAGHLADDAVEPVVVRAEVQSATLIAPGPASSGRAGLRALRGTWGAFAAVAFKRLSSRLPRRVRPKPLLVLTLMVLVAVLSSGVLLAVADPGYVDHLPLALSSAPTHPTASPGSVPTTPPTFASAATATPQSPPSPQGCVGGVAPAPGQGPLGPIYTTHGYAGVGNEVALTFDDGPNPSYTPQILADLQTAGVHATFFVIGRHAQEHPELVRQEWEDGNAIGNHTFDHEWIPGLSQQKLQQTLDKTATAIREATGDQCLWLFRPPYGDIAPTGAAPTPAPGMPTPTPVRPVPATSTRAWRVIRESGYTPINWDTSGHDWLLPGVGTIVRQINGELRPGAIILMHDGAPDTEKQDRRQTVAALPAVLDAIRAHGLRPVTLPQLLYDAGIVKRPIAPTPTPLPGHGGSDGDPGGAPPGGLVLLAPGMGELVQRLHLRR